MAAKERVLVVEDDPMVSELFEVLLRDADLEAVVAADAESAIEELRQRTFDLIVSDKNLPGLSGLDLLEWVKKNNPDLDVIIMTAYADMKSAVAAIHAGVYDYLVKPFDSLDEVMQKIRRGLERRRIKQENLRLIQYLTEANEQIEGMNAELEREVLQRTEELRKANARLEALTVTDDVTGLYNQRFLFPRLEDEVARERRYHDGLGVIMLDIDNFKKVNDKHDHLFGSRVLHRLGRILRAQVRNTDTLVRYGGDEFVIILPHTDMATASMVAERVRRAVEMTDVGDPADPQSTESHGPELYGDSYFVTVSLGVATVADSPVDSPRSLLRAADKALYAAKAAGRNCVRVMRGDEAMLAG